MAIWACVLPEPGAVMVAGVKPTVTPDSRAYADSAIAELKLPETAVVVVEVTCESGDSGRANVGSQTGNHNRCPCVLLGEQPPRAFSA